MLTAVLLIAALPALGQSQPAPSGRSLVLRSGDAVVVRPGTDARIVFSRRADVRISKGAVPTEVVVLIDQETGDGAPDGLVDRVFRHTLVEPFPDALVYRGDAIIEEVQVVADGAVGRPSAMTIVTAAGRLRFDTPSESGAPDDIFIRTTGGRGSTLVPGSYTGGRSFDEVEQVWLNHQEDSQSRVRASLSMTARSTGGLVVGPGPGSPADAGPPRDSEPSGRLTSWRLVPDSRPAEDGVTRPQVLSSVHASYPADAVRRAAEGIVRMEITVAEDGTVSGVRVLAGADPELNRAAIDAVRRWRFRPALDNGRAVTATVVAEIGFTAQTAAPRF